MLSQFENSSSCSQKHLRGGDKIQYVCISTKVSLRLNCTNRYIHCILLCIIYIIPLYMCIFYRIKLVNDIHPCRAQSLCHKTSLRFISDCLKVGNVFCLVFSSASINFLLVLFLLVAALGSYSFLERQYLGRFLFCLPSAFVFGYGFGFGFGCFCFCLCCAASFGLAFIIIIFTSAFFSLCSFIQSVPFTVLFALHSLCLSLYLSPSLFVTI